MRTIMSGKMPMELPTISVRMAPLPEDMLMRTGWSWNLQQPDLVQNPTVFPINTETPVILMIRVD